MSRAESGSITIGRSQDSVWQQLTRMDGLTDWYDDWDSCEHEPAERRLREGLTFRLRSARALRATADCEVVTVVEPTLLRWIEHRALRAPMLVEFRLTVDTPGSTVVTHVKSTGRLRRATRDEHPPALT